MNYPTGMKSETRRATERRPYEEEEGIGARSHEPQNWGHQNLDDKGNILPQHFQESIALPAY